MMTNEQILRQALRQQADVHLVNTYLPRATAIKARLSRLGYVVAATTAAASFALVAVSVTQHLGSSSQIEPAGSAAADASTIASGEAPNGSAWKLYSFANGDGQDCFGFTAAATDGSDQSCHSAASDTRSWLHLGSARLTQDGRDYGGALYGEVSRETEDVAITLQSGKVLSPQLIASADRPYLYFVVFVDPNTTGSVDLHDQRGRLIATSPFVLNRGLLGKQEP
jgi:hypothetical protein